MTRYISLVVKRLVIMGKRSSARGLIIEGSRCQTHCVKKFYTERRKKKKNHQRHAAALGSVTALANVLLYW